MNKTISWILAITLLLCTLCACTAPAGEGSGTEAETPTNAPSEAAPSGAESTEAEPTDTESPSAGGEETPIAPEWKYTVYELYGYDCIRGNHKTEISFERDEINVRSPHITSKTLDIAGSEIRMEYTGTRTSPNLAEETDLYKMTDSSDTDIQWLVSAEVGVETGRLLNYTQKPRSLHEENAPTSQKSRNECLAVAENWLRAEISDFDAYQLITESTVEDGSCPKYSFTFAKLEREGCVDAIKLDVSAVDDCLYYRVINPKKVDLELLLNEEMLRDVRALIVEKIHSIYTSDELYGSDKPGDFTYEIPDEITVEATVSADGTYALKARAEVSVVLFDDEYPYWTDINEFYVILEMLPPTATQESEEEFTEAEPTDTESTVPPLPELPTGRKELEMLYRRAHGLEDDAAFERYLYNDRWHKIPLPSLISVEHLYIGMTREEIASMIPAYAMIISRSNYRRYTTGGQPLVAIFFVDCDERYVVLELDKEECVEKITSYAKDEEVKSIDWDAMESIPVGSTIYDVIEIAGFPRYADGNYEFSFTDFGYSCFSFVDWYDDNLRVYKSMTDVCTEERYSNTVVERPRTPEASTEEPTEAEPSETFDPEEPSLMLETLVEESVT